MHYRQRLAGLVCGAPIGAVTWYVISGDAISALGGCAVTLMVMSFVFLWISYKEDVE